MSRSMLRIIDYYADVTEEFRRGFYICSVNAAR